MHDVVPRGFAAYARIFHPAHRDRPVGTPWPPLPYARHRREWEAFQRSDVQVDHERVTWHSVAEAFSTPSSPVSLHPMMQWSQLVGTDPFAMVQEDGPRDAEGWRYSDPAQGALEPDLVAATSTHLASHTQTPDAGCVAVWEGHGGLLGFTGDLPSRAFLQPGGDDPAHNKMLGRSIHDRFNNVFHKPTWQPGILPDEVSTGARLELPNRAYVLFRGGVTELADPDWQLSSPWRDVEAEAHGFGPSAHSPSLIWPDDRAWVLVTEVDFDSTIVGGSPALIAALCADPALEALRTDEGAVLGQGDAGLTP